MRLWLYEKCLNLGFRVSQSSCSQNCHKELNKPIYIWYLNTTRNELRCEALHTKIWASTFQVNYYSIAQQKGDCYIPFRDNRQLTWMFLLPVSQLSVTLNISVSFLVLPCFLLWKLKVGKYHLFCNEFQVSTNKTKQIIA